MNEAEELHDRRTLHYLFSELPLSPLDHRSPRFMAGVRFIVSVVVAVFATVVLLRGLWWGGDPGGPDRGTGLDWTRRPQPRPQSQTGAIY